MLNHAAIAQLVEQLICNQQVVGSSPIGSSISVEGYPSGQRGQTVNLLAQPSEVRILLPPPLIYRWVEMENRIELELVLGDILDSFTTSVDIWVNSRLKE